MTLFVLSLAACGSDGATPSTPVDAPLDVQDPSATDVPLDPVSDCIPGVARGVGDHLPSDWASPTWDGPPAAEGTFAHGVASGDPLSDRVILWTRLSLTAAMQAEPVEVAWEVATDETFGELVAAGWTETDASRDWTVKVDALGLGPGTSYRYRFFAMGRWSPVGRTMTAPSGCVTELRFAIASCGDYRQGYYLGYREIAARDDLNAVLFLGDYLYEYGSTVVRSVEPPWELKTLDDYRTRYAHYRRDPDLQAAHTLHPFIVVWDDHESANDAWVDGASGHGPSDGVWSERKAAAMQAYAEWMPIRDSVDGRIFRAFRFGDLVDLVMLDTRLWGRDQQADLGSQAEMADPDRTLLGLDQEAWLAEQLMGSEARFTVIGQQVMMGQFQAEGAALNPDQWDGYTASRDRFFDAVEASELRNLIVLSGDIHSSWASDLAREPTNPDAYDPTTGAGALGVEIVTPGLTSGLAGTALSDDILNLVDWASFAPHVRYRESVSRGYVILEVTPERAVGSWYHFDRVDREEGTSSLSQALAVHDGAPHLVEVPGPSPPR